MAVSICGKIFKGQDSSCEVQQKGHEQEIVVMNHTDLDTLTITRDCTETTSEYRVGFTLKQGATGVKFIGPAAGNMMKGTFAKTRADNGLVEYQHMGHILMAGINEEQKCILDALDKGRAFFAVKIRNYKRAPTGSPAGNEINEAIEIYGIGQGLVTADYDYDLTENGGLVDITLQSQDGAFENNLPYIYESATPGAEVTDFDDLFANPGSPGSQP